MSSPDPQSPTPSAPASGRDLDLIAAARAQARAGSGSKSSWAFIPPDTIPGYEVIKEIHRGGQGVVYQAIQKTTKRKVAVKVMREGPFAGARDRARFEREVEVLAQLNHPNIVSIIDSGQASGGPTHAAGGAFFFAMDYISGHPLDQWMSLQERTIDETLKVFAKVCDAVNAAHLKGVIHRDLKPSNIRVDASGEPHILDFGLAKVATGDVSGGDDQLRMMTMTGQFVGSLPWASPEQAEGHPDKVDVRTDVYSLGVVLYQMLTGGKFPYEVVGAMRDVLDNIMRAAPQRPSTVRRQINDEVETIVLKALSKERERRYQNAGELARDVRNYLGGFPIEAKRDSAVYQLRVIARRHRGAAAAVGAIAAVVVVSAAVATLLWREAEAQRTIAQARNTELTAALDREAAQRRRADENFASTRALARTFLYDINDEVAPLRGATRVRETMLTKARGYLEHLSTQAEREGHADTALERDLADACDRVGDLETALRQPRIGGAASGAEAYARARAIREAILSRNPSDWRAHAEAALSRVKTALALGAQMKHASAREELEASLAAYDMALSLAPDEPARLGVADDRAKARRALGDTLAQIASASDDISVCREFERLALDAYDRALSHWQERAAAEPSSDGVARQLAEVRNARTDVRMNTASALARRGAELAKAEDAGANALFDEAQQRYAEAEEQSKRAAEDLERLAAARPESAELQRSLWTALHAQGFAVMCTAMTHKLAAPHRPDGAAERERQNHERALAIYEKMLGVAQRLADADEADIDAQRTLAISLTRVGNQHRDVGRLDKAAAFFERSLSIRRDLLKTDPLTQHRRDLALGLFKSGQTEELIARGSSGEDRSRHAAAAKAYADEAQALFTSLADAGLIAKDAREFDSVRRLLANIGKLGPAP